MQESDPNCGHDEIPSPLPQPLLDETFFRRYFAGCESNGSSNPLQLPVDVSCKEKKDTIVDFPVDIDCVKQEAMEFDCGEIKTEIFESEHLPGDFVENILPDVQPARRKKANKPASLKPVCGCVAKCGEKFPDVERQQLLDGFQQLSPAEQNQFLHGLICREPTKRVRVECSRRSVTFYYHLPRGKELVKVCKTMFLNTYDVRETRIRRLAIGIGAKDVDEPSVPIKLEFVATETTISPGDVWPQEFPSIKTEEPDLFDAEQEDFVEDFPAEDEVPNEECNAAFEDGEDGSETDSMEEKLTEEVEAPASKSKQKIMKDRKVRGLSYTSRSGKERRAREVQPHCACYMKCYTRVPEELRQQLLAQLLRMPLAKQWKFLGDHICNKPALRQRSLAARFSNHYFLPVDSRLVKVCKTMFSATFDVTEQQQRGIISRKGENKHVVCGNPNFPKLLKKAVHKFYFEYDEGYDQSDRKQGGLEFCKCQLKCSRKFHQEVIDNIQSRFHHMSRGEQNDFLDAHIKRPMKDSPKNVLFAARYFLPLDATVEEVCRKTFLRALNVDASRISCILKHVEPTLEQALSSREPFEFARLHIGAYQMDTDHHCALSGTMRKLSHCPNVAQMYNEYLEGCQLGMEEPIDFRQYFGEFSQRFKESGLLLPTKCPDCGFFDRRVE